MCEIQANNFTTSNRLSGRERNEIWKQFELIFNWIGGWLPPPGGYMMYMNPSWSVLKAQRETSQDTSPDWVPFQGKLVSTSTASFHHYRNVHFKRTGLTQTYELQITRHLCECSSLSSSSVHDLQLSQVSAEGEVGGWGGGQTVLVLR